LVLALVSLVAMSAFAADKTPVTLSGKAKIGYTFKFADAGTTIGIAKTPTVYLDSLAIKGDVFKVGISNPPAFTDDYDTKGYAELYIDKIAKAAGSDWGKFTLTVGSGNSKGTMGAPHVYADPNSTVSDNSYARLRMKGTASAYATIGYDTFLSVYLAADPTMWTGSSKKGSFLVNAKVVPMDGLSFAVGYTGYAERKTDVTKATLIEYYVDPSDGSIKTRSVTTSTVGLYEKGAIGGSVKVDVKALAKLKFDLTFSAIDALYFYADGDATKTVNDMIASVSGGMDSWAAYFEYQLFGNRADSSKNANNMVAKFTYKGIKNTSIYAKFAMNDFTAEKADGADQFTVSAGASYAMAPCTFALDASLTPVKAKKATFAITPSIVVAF
jgi:hypothetical protein